MFISIGGGVAYTKHTNLKSDRKEYKAGFTSNPSAGAYLLQNNNTLSCYGSACTTAPYVDLDDNGVALYVTAGTTITANRDSSNYTFWLLDKDGNEGLNKSTINVSVNGSNLSVASDTWSWNGNWTSGLTSKYKNATITTNNAVLGAAIYLESQLGTTALNRANSSVLRVKIIDPYYIGYDQNYNGENIKDTVISYYGASYTTNGAYSRTGYIFNNWNTNSNGTGTAVNAGSSYSVPQTNTVFYAQWTPITYKIKFNANGGTGSMSEQTFTYDNSQKLNKNEFANAGKIFNCWATNPDGTGTKYTDEQSIINLTSTNSQTINLYAQWEDASEFYFSYNSNGGEGTMPNQKFTNGSVQSLSNNTFTKTGYIFKEWTTNVDGTGEKYTDGEEVTKSGVAENDVVTLYAQWTPITYKIKFNANGGTGSMSEQTLTYDSNDKLSKNTFTKEGYVFSKWTINVDGTGTSYDDEQNIINLTSVKDQTITLYAQWEKAAEYYFSYESNGGEGTMPAQKFTSGVNQTIAANTFTKKGYKFKEWNTSLDGTGTKYKDGESVIKTGVTQDEIIPLYAQWEIIEYTVSLDYNGGTSTSPSTFTFNIEKDNIKVENPTKKGYEFKGWTGTNLTEPTKDLIIEKGSISDRTYKANWEVKQYKLELTKTDGISTITGAGTYDYDEQVTIAITLEDGYEFDGWYAGDTKIADDTTYSFNMKDENVGYQAKAKLKSYNVEYLEKKDDSSEIKNISLEHGSKIKTIINDKETIITITENTEISNPAIEGYEFRGWEASVSDGINVLTAIYDINVYSINITIKKDDVEETNKIETVEYNKNKIIDFSGIEGYTLDTATLDGELISISNNKYQIDNIKSNHNIVVNYSVDINKDNIPDKYEYKILFKVENGTWEDTKNSDERYIYYPSHEYKNGQWENLTEVSLTNLPNVKPDENYKEGTWNEDIKLGYIISSDNTYTYSCVREYKFTLQPKDTISKKEEIDIKWQTNFDPIKIIIYDKDDKVIEELDPNATNTTIKIKDKDKKEQYFIRAYYGDKDDEYINSDLFALTYSTSKNPSTGDNIIKYIVLFSISMIAVASKPLYIKIKKICNKKL